MIPDTYGGYHRPDYRVSNKTLILCQNVTRTHNVSVSLPLALSATVSPTTRFLSMSARRTGLRRICLVLCVNEDTDGFCFVGNHVLELSERPLVQLLVGFFAILYGLSYVLYVSNDNRFYLSRAARRNKA